MNSFFHDDEVIVQILSFLDFDSVNDVVSKTCVRFNRCSRRAMICSLGKKTTEEKEIQDACSPEQEESQDDGSATPPALIPHEDAIVRCFYEEGVHVVLRQGWSIWSQDRESVSDDVIRFIEHKRNDLPGFNENLTTEIKNQYRIYYPHFFVLFGNEDEGDSVGWMFSTYDNNLRHARVNVLNELNKMKLVHENNNNDDDSDSSSDHMNDNDIDVHESDDGSLDNVNELYNYEEGGNEGIDIEGDDDSDMFVSDNESIDNHSSSDGSDGISYNNNEDIFIFMDEVTDNDMRILNHYLKCMIHFNQ